ncbi:hypothetical protein K435DRAFT_776824 [Dendrothele bispora CBS 962.96]|uniref:Smr domain-containing protein n=1 Tax=Dendrothele bispora (strain CBS 962.96) TaxID=1314807 RepID=A0A4S8MD87_DENBC|nr:hypothetical protein K435DRAFT_776824 [Dendrothele bispora CBS 962.96]
MQLVISSLIGLSLRYFAHSSNLGLALLGAWEGICLYHLSSTFPSSYDPHLAYALRLCFDIFLTRNPYRVVLILLWSLLSNFASDALNDQHFYDTTREKRAHRPSSSRHTRERKRSSSRIISPPSTSYSYKSSSVTSTVGTLNSPSGVISPTQDQPSTLYIRTPVFDVGDVRSTDDPEAPSTGLPLPIVPFTDISSVDDTARPVPSATGLEEAAIEAISTDFVPDTFEPSLPVLAPHPMPLITDSLPPLNEDPIMTGVMQTDVGAHESGGDELQTPMLPGLPVEITDHVDELTTPPARSILLSTTIAMGEGDEESVTAVEQPQRRPIAPQRMQSAASGSNTPIPVPVPRVGSSLKAQIVASPVDSEISATEPSQNFARAESLRDQAWKEVEYQKQLKLDLEKAIREGNTKDAFMLAVDLDESKKRIFSLHSRARRRYLLARNHESEDGVVDVHGLLVPEAIEVTELAFRDALRNGKSQLQVIVGKGKHSQDKVPKLKPAISKAMKKHGIECVVNPRNAGVLLLSLSV